MPRIHKTILSVTLAILLTAGLCGCSNKNEGKPNPDLKVPEVPTGGKDAKNPGKQ